MYGGFIFMLMRISVSVVAPSMDPHLTFYSVNFDVYLNIFMGCIVFISSSESFLWKESSNNLINKTIKIHEKKYKTRSVPYIVVMVYCIHVTV